MSVEAIAIVLHHATDVSGTDKVVLVGIANHDGDGGAWPTMATLAKYAAVEERAVRRAVRRLEDADLIAVDVKEGGLRSTRNDRRPNRYRILIRCPDDCDGTTAHRVPRDR